MSELTDERRTEIYKSVLKGQDWLDEEKPGWYNNIDLDIFRIIAPASCVLGQVFMEKFGEANGYHHFKNEFGLDWVMEHGFSLTSVENMEAWGFLGDLWVSVIMQRRWIDEFEAA